MRGRGITYDTGFFNGGFSTHEPFVGELVRREMRVIHDELHCNAVRITGGDQDRLERAAVHAAAAGLEVWYSPFTGDLSQDELLAFIGDSAGRAERIRKDGAEVVMVTGSELSLSTTGFLPGDSLVERLGLLAQPGRLRALFAEVPPLINLFLGRALDLTRKRFGGKVTYASLPFEGVDWGPFDFVSTDGGYRSADIAARFRDGVRALVAQGKPAAITEFGCCTYRGAADLGGKGDSILDWDGAKPVLRKGEYVRDEEEQAAYLMELLEIFDAEGVDTAFVNTFARYDLPHRTDERQDLDLASYGVVRVLEGGRQWEPKRAFNALAAYYSR